jgi:PAS domain S-box-containing protein
VPPHSLTDLAGLRISAESFLAAVSETVAQPVWVVDPNDVIRFANPAAITALGYDSADMLLGRRRHETIHYKHPNGTPYPAADCPMLLPRTTGQTVARDLDWLFRRDGSRFPVSYVSLPIELPEGRGAVVAFAGIENRLGAEHVLGGHDAVLGAREDSLRRIAALVAGGAASGDVFAAIAREVAQVVDLPLVLVWRLEPGNTTATVIAEWSEVPHSWQAGTRWPLDGPGLAVQILKTGRPARIDDYSELPGTMAAASRETRLQGSAGAPIIVDGDMWGWMAAATSRGRLPDQIEDRLAEFTELVATAISNTESRAALGRLAEEQAALRRVATLVASGRAPETLFAAVANEVGQLLSVDLANVGRYEPDGTLTLVASAGDLFPVGSRWPLGGQTNLATLVLETGRPARLDDYAQARGRLADGIREAGIRSAVATPIIVEGRLWGLMAAGTRQEQALPPDTEARVASFTDLVATAIANAESRAALARLAEEQAALRRVATLVARGVPQEEVFAAATEGVMQLLSVSHAGMGRYESEGAVTVVATAGGAGDHAAVGSRRPLGGNDPATLVFETGGPVRIDGLTDPSGPIGASGHEHAIHSAVAAPVVVEGRLWGAMIVYSTVERPLPADAEARVASFTELVATAIANTESRTEVGRLVSEQAALRRVATLVARESPAAEVLAAVAEEVLRVLGVEITRLYRYEADGTATIVANAGAEETRIGVGTRVPIGGRNIAALIHRTGRPARIDDHADATGALGIRAVELGVRCGVGAPIVVGDRLWGAIIVASRLPEPLPASTESRVAKFTKLVATSISNVQARSELAASRARVVAAADAERRRVVRDLHDGAQQRLVHTILTLKLAQRALPPHRDAESELVAEALDHAERAHVELRELAHGILPAALTQGGLRTGVDALASRVPVPVENGVAVGRLPDAVEATAYFVVAEALTNVAKHARAQRVAVTAHIEDGTLAVRVRDDGIGGARLDGSGLVGLADRLAVLGGRLRVESPVDVGTLVAAEIPLSSLIGRDSRRSEPGGNR